MLILSPVAIQTYKCTRCPTVVVVIIVREFLADGCLSEINVSAEIKKNCAKDLVAPDRYAFTAAKVSPLSNISVVMILSVEPSLLFDEGRHLSKVCEVRTL